MNYYPWMEKCCDDVDIRDLTDLGVGRAFNFFAIFEKYERKKQFYPDQNLQFLFLHILFECRHPLHIYCRTILFLHKYLVRIMGQLIWYYFKLLSAQVLDPWPQKNLLEVKKKTDELAQHYLQIPRDFVPRSISKINDLTIARYWKIVLKCLYNPSSLF